MSICAYQYHYVNILPYALSPVAGPLRYWTMLFISSVSLFQIFSLNCTNHGVIGQWRPRHARLPVNNVNYNTIALHDVTDKHGINHRNFDLITGPYFATFFEHFDFLNQTNILFICDIECFRSFPIFQDTRVLVYIILQLNALRVRWCTKLFGRT